MSSQPEPSSKDKLPQGADLKDAPRQLLPFEPKARKSNRQKPSEKLPLASTPEQAKPGANLGRSDRTSGIPDEVSRRMVWRMALFCGIPSALGMATFVVSYFIVSNDIFVLPTYAVLLVSLGWFGLGVVGLTYGVLSASWDEGVMGSRLGLAEFQTNWGRMSDTWRMNAAQSSASKKAKKSG